MRHKMMINEWMAAAPHTGAGGLGFGPVVAWGRRSAQRGLASPQSERPRGLSVLEPTKAALDAFLNFRGFLIRMRLQVLAVPSSPPAGWRLSLGEARAPEGAGPERGGGEAEGRSQGLFGASGSWKTGLPV